MLLWAPFKVCSERTETYTERSVIMRHRRLVGLRKYILLTAVVYFINAFQLVAEETGTCNAREKQSILRLVRDTLHLYLNTGNVPSLADYTITPALQKKCGVFVTLKERTTGNLRGCIGYIIGHKPLAEAVIDCTVQAATRDRRFRPLKQGEDTSVYTEVSVLTPPRKIASLDEIKLGTHGLMITRGFHSGVLLPQVAGEFGWNKEEFLTALCKKAGLPDRAWEQGAELYVFSAQVFGEDQRHAQHP